jgi:succinate-acetate transporter protein
MANIARIEQHERWTHSGPVSTSLEDEQVSVLEQRSRATVAAPEPLGLWGFATGTWISGTVIAGIFPLTGAAAAIPVVIVFAGVAQFIAGLFAYRRANVLSSTAFCCFGAFNVILGIFFLMAVGTMLGTGGAALGLGAAATGAATGTAPGAAASGAAGGASAAMVVMGFVLESFAFIALSLTLAAARMNVVFSIFLGLLTIGYCLSGIPFLAGAVGTPGWGIVGSIGGWFLVASALFAFYAGAALVVNSMWERTLLPLGGTA